MRSVPGYVVMRPQNKQHLIAILTALAVISLAAPAHAALTATVRDASYLTITAEELPQSLFLPDASAGWCPVPLDDFNNSQSDTRWVGLPSDMSAPPVIQSRLSVGQMAQVPNIELFVPSASETLVMDPMARAPEDRVLDMLDPPRSV
jgi:hypothetical protein